MGGGYSIVVTDGPDGGTTLDDINQVSVSGNAPGGGDPPTTWVVSASEDVGGGNIDDFWVLTAYVICATGAP